MTQSILSWISVRSYATYRNCSTGATTSSHRSSNRTLLNDAALHLLPADCPSPKDHAGQGLSPQAEQLLRRLNNECMTPLTHAMRVGNVPMYERLKNRMKTTLWIYGGVSLEQHPLEQFDRFAVHHSHPLPPTHPGSLLPHFTRRLCVQFPRRQCGQCLGQDGITVASR